ncbi:MAG: hypothetical protein RLZZ458_2649 [Planctomycetota bacterium]|jgi:uncharacterized protein (DUF58 family)
MSSPLPDSRQFVIAVRKLADSFSYGTDRSPFRGSGIEYVQSRQYQPGDPVRALDWRILARTGKPYIREFETPKRLPCYLLLDTSASMTISSFRRSKYETALQLAGGLGLACLERVSPVGLLATGETALHIRPSLSRDTILQWLLQLRRSRFDEKTTLSEKLARLSPSLLNRTLLIILSDLHDPHAAAAIRQIGQRHECVVLQLRDPLEDGLPAAGYIRAVEAETGRTIVTHSSDTHTAQETLQQELKRAGVDHLVIRTDQQWLPAVRNFLKARGVLNRGAR